MMSEFARNGRQSTVVLPSDFTATAADVRADAVGAQETEGADEFVIVEEEGK